MVYLPRKMDEAHVALQFRSELEELRQEVDQRLTVLETPARVESTVIASPNYLPNSHPEWSTKAYTTIGTTADDADPTNHKAYNWYYAASSDTALSTSTPLVDSVHPDYATLDDNAPIWDKENARIKMGWEAVELVQTSFDVVCPLPTDFVFPGQKYYVYFETLLTANTVNLDGAEFFCGFWDNTGTQQKWIEGGDFTPDYNVYGVPGTRTLKYKVRATTDGGEQILSTEITVANAPNLLTSDSHVRLFFNGVAGFIRFEIYRRDGSVYRKVGDIKNSIDLQFYDMQEDVGSFESGYPTITTHRPQAKAVTLGLTGNAVSYTPHTMVIRIPTSYDRSNTDDGNQWFRFGLNGLISDARSLCIRRIMVSEGFGPWTRSNSDMQAASGPSSTAASSPGSGSLIVVDVNDNGPACVTLDTMVDVMYQRGRADVKDSIPISELEVGMNVFCGAQALPVTAIKDGIVQEIYEIETNSGLNLRCSSSHRIIRSYFDKFGTAARYLKVGDNILTGKDNAVKLDVITKILVHYGATPVRSITIPKPNLYITNGIISHNDKAAPTVTNNY